MRSKTLKGRKRGIPDGAGFVAIRSVSTLTAISQRLGIQESVLGSAAAAGSLVAIAALVRLLRSSERIKGGEGRIVLVTGCDTGFGPVIATQLAQRGFTVYAGCLTQEGISRIRALGLANLRAVEMDVTRDDHVNAVKTLIEKEAAEGVFAVVNNAGVFAAYKWELSSMDAIRRDVEVNYLGVVRVSKAFLPLLRKFAASPRAASFKPRIVTISSAAGTQKSSPLGSYMSSKHAVQAFSATLRQEIRAQGILYSSIEPGVANTPIVAPSFVSQKKIDDIIAGNPPDILALYGGETEIRRKMALSGIHTKVQSMMPAQMVVDAVVEQVELAVPVLNVHVGFEAKLLIFMSTYLPASWMDQFAIDLDNSI
ncbi:NAD(P)-binding protein [Gonapodya prolifera JEL478]|uniref:NAD(P)-binding protein n=1 Tax=Gonapodya prolifera (strain JEL478) TaxID=1344416 RepID=A0A139AIW9_GONPJ|nr:NAD(P)-binding protein [Gonapodya prolifera JEL478]|eukprot:KXS16345.1 NAD(P)-binding protein [Gonapodya prolifera JEL478]